MTRLRFSLRRHFGFAFAVVAVALLVRAMVPLGWMPDAANGLFAVRPCGAAARVAAPMADHHHHPEHRQGHNHAPDHERGQQPCAFAGLASASAPPEMPEDLASPVLAAEQYLAAGDAFILAHAARQLPPARGPPITA